MYGRLPRQPIELHKWWWLDCWWTHGAIEPSDEYAVSLRDPYAPEEDEVAAGLPDEGRLVCLRQVVDGRYP